MIESQIRYRNGYKYQLATDYFCALEFKPCSEITSEFIELDTNGVLYLHRGYAWDGPSGPALDTKSFMRASLVHDALYQLIGMELLPKKCKPLADMEMRRICIEDGMSRIRAWYTFKAVQVFGGNHLATKPVISAP